MANPRNRVPENVLPVLLENEADERRRVKHHMSEPEFIDPSQLRPGPIRNESLPPELLDQIKAVFDVIGPYTRTKNPTE
jgi:hypothetical protein